MVDLLKGDCLELMKNIPDGSVDLVLTDPPYGVMGKSTHDIKGWENRNIDWDKNIDHKAVFFECERVLRVNGKCVLFSQEPYTSKLIADYTPGMAFLYRAVWVKNNAGNVLGCKRNMVSYFEDICVFSKKEYDYDHKHPSRDYLMREKEKCAGVDFKKLLGNSMASHYFTRGFQFSIPSRENYDKLQTTGFFQKPYEELLDENRRYRESVPKPTFNLWQGGKFKSNVLQYPKDGDGFHPTQKPVALLEDLIQTFSNLGDIILDFTMGSGSTGVACVKTGREFIGIELDEKYFEIAKNRIEEAKNEQPTI